MEENDNDNYFPSILNSRIFKKLNDSNIPQSQCTIRSRFSLSLKRKSTNTPIKNELPEESHSKIENLKKESIISNECNNVVTKKSISFDSIGYSAIEDLISKNDCDDLNHTILDDISLQNLSDGDVNVSNNNSGSFKTAFLDNDDVISCRSGISDDKTIIYTPVSSCDTNSHNIEVQVNNHNLQIKHSNINVDVTINKGSQLSEETLKNDVNLNNTFLKTTKRKSASVNIKIKKQKKAGTDISTGSKVLVLNTDDNVIVKLQNCNSVNQKSNCINSEGSSKTKLVFGNGKSIESNNLKSKLKYTDFQCSKSLFSPLICDKGKYSEKWADVYKRKNLVRDDAQDMSRKSNNYDVIGRTSDNRQRNGTKSPSPQGISSARDVKPAYPEDRRASSSVSKKSTGSFSSRNVDNSLFNALSKSKSNKTSAVAINIPHYKIVAGTHFAVDAFSYGEIPNVKHYFLTHFHSDHYSGLRKSFNKLLYCSKITADLCVSRLGVNRKCINIVNVDAPIKIDGVEITAVDANHCPGALMLIFSLPNGKTLLHTGDFRAIPTMETYPVFWNKDVHTVYLDTTYCNPRYDFPTQDQSLEKAVYLLKLKKKALEDANKSFSKLLIVCGTYTIGKEKFFLGLARRVSCSVWACPEKDKVLQIVEARSFNQLPRHQCQLHVVPMRDLTHEKLRSYLDSLQGAFDEVIAFKPSGWENGKNSFVERDCVTIHGIPYSEHSSFSELIRFIKFLKPKRVIPTVDISGGIKSVQKYFPCPLVNKDDVHYQTRLTDYFSLQK